MEEDQRDAILGKGGGVLHGMVNIRNRVLLKTLAVAAFVAILVLIGLMFRYAVWLAVIVFLVCVSVGVLSVYRREGLRRALLDLLKDLLTGW